MPCRALNAQLLCNAISLIELFYDICENSGIEVNEQTPGHGDRKD